MGMEWTHIATPKGIECRVLTGGTGAPLVFVHGAGGLQEDDAMLARLAERFTVFAPELPGYGESTGEQLLATMLDFTLHSWDVVDALGLEAPALVAHSMGGMIAAEMACLCPERVPKLGLVAPAGLWLDDHPIADLFATLPHELPALLYHDPERGAAQLTGGSDFSDPNALVEFFVGNARRLGTAGKLMFPIPNRRLSDRLYRLRAETLLVWGESDRFIPALYAARWQELIPKAELVMIAEAGHAAPGEQPDAVAAAIGAFLADEH
jgi:pimeloyl-ACP methyl ester carboxylesterase